MQLHSAIVSIIIYTQVSDIINGCDVNRLVFCIAKHVSIQSAREPLVCQFHINGSRAVYITHTAKMGKRPRPGRVGDKRRLRPAVKVVLRLGRVHTKNVLLKAL